MADDWINVPFISPELFRDFVLPPYLAIERFHGGIGSVHSCGNQAPVQRYLLEIRSLPQLEVSAWTSLDETLVNVPASKTLWISLHPNDVLCASPTEMEAKLRSDHRALPRADVRDRHLGPDPALARRRHVRGDGQDVDTHRATRAGGDDGRLTAGHLSPVPHRVYTWHGGTPWLDYVC